MTSNTLKDSSPNNLFCCRLSFIRNYCSHLETEGIFLYDIEKEKIKFSAVGKMSDNFIKRYKGRKEFEILKSDITNYEVLDDQKNKMFYNVLTIKGIKGKIHKTFIAYQGENTDFEKLKEKFLLIESFIKGKTDDLENYKKELKKMDTVTKKKICFFARHKDLLILFQKLFQIYDVQKILYHIKCLLPGIINVNLGENKIQLSRDEELIISNQLMKRKFNINKLISSDISISRNFYNKVNKPQFEPDFFWLNFYERQKDNNTYLVGDYKPFESNDNYNKKVNDNNLFEELEKNKYYYDEYETNYLFKEDKEVPGEFKILNNYSINKMKEINYFSYSPQNLNIYNQSKKNILSSVIQNKSMKIELNFNNKIKKPKRIPKFELYNKILHMKENYEKNKEINKNKSTIKTINEEVDKIHYLSNNLNNSANDIRYIWKNIFFIRVLSFICKKDKIDYEKNKEKIDQEKGKKIALQTKEIRNEMNNIINELKEKENKTERKPIIDFLMKYAEYNLKN